MVTYTENYVIVPNGFNDNETLLTFYETPSFSLLAMSAKLMIFNTIKPY